MPEGPVAGRGVQRPVAQTRAIQPAALIAVRVCEHDVLDVTDSDLVQVFEPASRRKVDD